MKTRKKLFFTLIIVSLICAVCVSCKISQVKKPDCEEIVKFKEYNCKV